MAAALAEIPTKEWNAATVCGKDEISTRWAIAINRFSEMTEANKVLLTDNDIPAV